jgi:hypothetical protein
MTAAEPSVEPEPAPEHTSWDPLLTLAEVPIAALTWWIGGFLPWLLNDAGHEVLGASGVALLALPLVAGNLSGLVLGAGLGGVLAGLTTRLGSGSRAVRAGACAGGVAIALLATLLQSRSGLSGSTGRVDERITNGLTVVVVIMTIVGLGLGLLSLTGRIGLGLALAAAAGATPMWVMSVLNARQLDDTASGLRAAVDISQWAGAVLLAVALVAVGLRQARQVVAWPGAVLLAWFIGPTITAAGYMDVFVRPGGLPGRWADHLSAAMDVWRMAASPHARSLTPWIVAIVIAGGVAFWLARRQPDSTGSLGLSKGQPAQ